MNVDPAGLLASRWLYQGRETMNRFEDSSERGDGLDLVGNTNAATDFSRVDANALRSSITAASRDLAEAGILPNVDIFQVQERTPTTEKWLRTAHPSPDEPTTLLRPTDAPVIYNASTRLPIAHPEPAWAGRRAPDATRTATNGTVREYWDAKGYGLGGDPAGTFAVREKDPDGTLVYSESSPGLGQPPTFRATVYGRPTVTGRLMEATAGEQGVAISSRVTRSGATEYERSDRVNGKWLYPHVISPEVARAEIDQYRRLILR